MRGRLSRIGQYLKPSAGAIVLLLALLFIQAMSDLSLPSYTSNIINVGIQQSGIEDAVPLRIREATLNRLYLLMTKDEADQVRQAYEIKSDGMLQLKTITNAQREQLDGILGKRMLVLYGLQSNSDMAKMFTSQLPQGVDLWAALSSMTAAQREALVQKMDQMTAQLPPSIVQQTAIAFVKTEYQACGVSVGAQQMSYLWSTGLKMIGLVLVSVTSAVIVIFLSARVAAGFSKRLREAVFKKVISFGSLEFDKFSTASLITRSTNDIQQVQMMMTMTFRILIYSPILAIGGIIKALSTNMSMAWIIGVGVAAVLLVVITLMGIAMPRFRRMQLLIDRLNLVTREILTGIPVIRAFCTQKHETKRFDAANIDLMKVNLFVNRLMVWMMPLMMLIMNGLSVLIIYRGAIGVNLGQMQVGDLMAFIQYAMQIIMSFLMISMISIMLPRASVSIARINEVLSSEASVLDPPHPKDPNPAMRGEVKFDHVSFRYPNAEENVLTDISFTAKHGLTTAIIGSTGSGENDADPSDPALFRCDAGERFGLGCGRARAFAERASRYDRVCAAAQCAVLRHHRFQPALRARGRYRRGTGAVG